MLNDELLRPFSVNGLLIVLGIRYEVLINL